jgi:hypothetical protein
MAGGPATLHAQFQALFLGRPCRLLAPPRVQSRRLHRQVVAMSAVAAPAELDVKAFDGEAAGTEHLALKIADKSTANGLVHRYLITVRQNNRAVRFRDGPRAPSALLAAAQRPTPPSLAQPSRCRALGLTPQIAERRISLCGLRRIREQPAR